MPKTVIRNKIPKRPTTSKQPEPAKGWPFGKTATGGRKNIDINKKRTHKIDINKRKTGK